MTLDELIKERDRLNEEIKKLRTREIVDGRAKFRVKNEHLYQFCLLREPADGVHGSTFTAIVESKDSQDAIRQAKALIKDLQAVITKVQKIDLMNTDSL